MASTEVEIARLILSVGVGALMGWYIYSNITIVKIEIWMAAVVAIVTFLLVYLIFSRVIGRSGG